MTDNEKSLYQSEVIKKIIGPITPMGKSELDSTRLENLKEMCFVVSELIGEIRYVSRSKDNYESSVKAIGEYADKYLRNELGIQE